MSRVGKQPVEIPDKAKVEVSEDNVVRVTGPLGELSFGFHPDMRIAVEGDVVQVSRPTNQRQHRSLHGVTRSLIANMVHGVTEGYEKRLLLNGVGYRAELSGKTLVLRVGYSHSVEIEPLGDTTFEVEANTTVIVRGIDKQAVGQVAADIRAVRPVEPYRGRGIRYIDEHVRRKAGKARVGQM